MKTKIKKGSKKASKGKAKAKAKVKEVIKAATVKADSKVKITPKTGHDFNSNNEVGANGTPTKVWAQFPCNNESNTKINAHLKGKGYRTFASYVCDLIAHDMGLKK